METQQAKIIALIQYHVIRDTFLNTKLAEGLFQEQEFKKSSIVYAEICMCVCILGILVS